MSEGSLRDSARDNRSGQRSSSLQIIEKLDFTQGWVGSHSKL